MIRAYRLSHVAYCLLPVCEYLERHRQDFESFQTDGSFERYVNNMRIPGAWGDHVTLAAMSRMFHATITIVNDRESAQYPGDTNGSHQIMGHNKSLQSSDSTYA